jgi:nicotinate-nucleotide adenylyltransferase
MIHSKKIIGLFGGSFDPIHFGHLYLAKYLYEHLSLDEIQFIPCKLSPLKLHTHAGVQHRLAMLKLALSHYPGFVINDCELSRPAPSYTVDTLIILKQQHPDAHFSFILGADVLLQFRQWYRWKDILHLTHFIVIPRPEVHLPKKSWITQLVEKNQCFSIQALQHFSAGKFLLQSPPPHLISATVIRDKIAQGEDVRSLVPEEVLQYILLHKLYK